MFGSFKITLAATYIVVAVVGLLARLLQVWGDWGELMWLPPIGADGKAVTLILGGWVLLMFLLAITPDPSVGYKTSNGVLGALLLTLAGLLAAQFLLDVPEGGGEPIWQWSQTVNGILLSPGATLLSVMAFFHAFMTELAVVAPDDHRARATVSSD